MPAGIAPHFPHRLVSNMSRFPPSQECGTKELGGAASRKHFFFSPSAPLLATREEHKSLSWKDFGGAASELKGWLILLSDGRQRCPSQVAMQQATHMGGITFLTAQISSTKSGPAVPPARSGWTAGTHAAVWWPRVARQG